MRLLITEVAPRDYSQEAALGGYVLEEVASPVFKNDSDMLPMEQRVTAASNSIAQSKVIVANAFDPVADQIADASSYLAQWSDVMVGHYFLPSVAAAAQTAGIPHVLVQLTHGFVPSRHANPLGSAGFGSVGNRLLWSMTTWMTNRLLLERANKVRDELGQPPIRDVIRQSWISPHLTLVAVSRALCAPQPDWSASCRVTGFLHRSPGSETSGEQPSHVPIDGKGAVFFTFGSLMPVDRESIESTVRMWMHAAELAGVPAILQCPQPTGMETPPSVRVIGRCDHAAVFPTCAAVVHHGGAGTTQSAIRAGVPSVVVPHVADQFFWGSTLQRMHLGRMTCKRRKVSADEIAKALRKLLDDTRVRNACLEARDIAANEDGVSTAVREIESLLSSSKP